VGTRHTVLQDTCHAKIHIEYYKDTGKLDTRKLYFLILAIQKYKLNTIEIQICCSAT
jgi:hypothetical protein